MRPYQRRPETVLRNLSLSLYDSMKADTNTRVKASFCHMSRAVAADWAAVPRVCIASSFRV